MTMLISVVSWFVLLLIGAVVIAGVFAVMAGRSALLEAQQKMD